MDNKKFCKYCGETIDKELIVCPKCGRQLKLVKEEENKTKVEKKEKDEKNKFYTQPWFMWVMLIFFSPVGIFFMWKFHPEMKKNIKIILSIVFGLLFLFAITNGSSSNTNSSDGRNINVPGSTSRTKVEVIDFSSMKESEILVWCKENNLNCDFKREYSESVAKDNFIKQSVSANEKVYEKSSVTITFSLGKEPTKGQKNALKKAESYSKLMHMSKSRIYEQLTSEYGEGFTAEEAQYAMDNLVADWNKNALEKAKSYQKTMNMSKSRIYEQLTSEYGEGFTAEEAQYAIDHLED